MLEEANTNIALICHVVIVFFFYISHGSTQWQAMSICRSHPGKSHPYYPWCWYAAESIPLLWSCYLWLWLYWSTRWHLGEPASHSTLPYTVLWASKNLYNVTNSILNKCCSLSSTSVFNIDTKCSCTPNQHIRMILWHRTRNVCLSEMHWMFIIFSWPTEHSRA